MYKLILCSAANEKEMLRIEDGMNGLAREGYRYCGKLMMPALNAGHMPTQLSVIIMERTADDADAANHEAWRNEQEATSNPFANISTLPH